MTQSSLASYIRWKGNVSTALPFDNTSLLPIINNAKDQVAQAIVQVNPDFFGDVSTTTTVSGQQEYTRPSNLLLMKRIDVSYTDTNTGSYHMAQPTTLAELKDHGEDWYAANQSQTEPLYRFDDTGFFLYPTPTSTSAGAAFLRLFWVPKPADFADLTEAVTDIQDLNGFTPNFQQLIGDLTVYMIREKKGEITALDVQKNQAHIMDTLVPSAFRILSTTQAPIPHDANLQY